MFVSIALAASLQAAQPEVQSADPADTAALPSPSAQQVSNAEARSVYDEMVFAAAAQARRRPPRDDSPDQIRRMAASDQNHERYFKRPGATRPDYDLEWQQCRQIARRLAASSVDGTIGGTFTNSYYQNVSPIGAAMGGMIGSAFAAAMAERRARRDLRRHCLVARGWRLVEPNEAGGERIAALTRAERISYFDRMIGAEQVEADANVIDWQTLAAAPNKVALDGEESVEDGE